MISLCKSVEDTFASIQKGKYCATMYLHTRTYTHTHIPQTISVLVARCVSDLICFKSKTASFYCPTKKTPVLLLVYLHLNWSADVWIT